MLEHSSRFFSHRKRIVISILFLSLLLRWILIFGGGQYYISDETRYEVSRDAARLLVQGQWVGALRQFTISPEHLGFKVFGLIPALTEQIVGPSLVLPAMFFSFFSILNLYLIFLLSQRSQVSSHEPLYALFLAACCVSLLYYSRHLFPYDLAMSFGLFALYIALARPSRVETSLACGGLGFLCFITYNGYWALAGFAMFVNILTNNTKRTDILKKIVFTGIGFLVPLALLIISLLASGTDMVSHYRLFATSIRQGSFEEGWSLPLEYFWHAEHLVMILLGFLSLRAIWGLFYAENRQAIIWGIGVIFVYLCLLVPSVFFHSFVVYARLARQLIPFIILLAANGLAVLRAHEITSYQTTFAVLTVILVQAAWNFGMSYQLDYPRQFSQELQAQFSGFEFSSKRLAYGAPTVCQSNGYAIENAKYFLSAPETTQPVAGEILREVLHPVNFLPYQYEGYTPEERKEFRQQQLRMRFYKVDAEFASESNPDWTSIKNCAVRGDEN